MIENTFIGIRNVTFIDSNQIVFAHFRETKRDFTVNCAKIATIFLDATNIICDLKTQYIFFFDSYISQIIRLQSLGALCSKVLIFFKDSRVTYQKTRNG